MTRPDWMDNIRGIWFDLDGTLYDHLEASNRALVEVHERNPAVNIVPLALWRNAFHQRNAECWAAAEEGRMDQKIIRSERFRLTLRDVGIMSSDLADICDALYRESYPKQATPIAHVVDAFRAAEMSELKVGILTNGFSESQHAKLAAIGLESKFTIVSEEVGAMKPDRAIFRAAEKMMNLPPETLLMVGDRYDSDITGAYLAGWRTLWLKDETQEPEKCVADLVAVDRTDFTDLFAHA